LPFRRKKQAAALLLILFNKVIKALHAPSLVRLTSSFSWYTKQSTRLHSKRSVSCLRSAACFLQSVASSACAASSSRSLLLAMLGGEGSRSII